MYTYRRGVLFDITIRANLSIFIRHYRHKVQLPSRQFKIRTPLIKLPVAP